MIKDLRSQSLAHSQWAAGEAVTKVEACQARTFTRHAPQRPLHTRNSFPTVTVLARVAPCSDQSYIVLPTGRCRSFHVGEGKGLRHPLCHSHCKVCNLLVHIHEERVA